jgi:hypothetical protein
MAWKIDVFNSSYEGSHNVGLRGMRGFTPSLQLELRQQHGADKHHVTATMLV